MLLRTLIRAALLASLAFGVFQASPAAAQDKKTSCKKPPEFIQPPKKSKEEEAQAKKTFKGPATGTVSIEVSEDGDVVDAKTVRASSAEVADRLLSAAKDMKFKPRPGCGPVKFEVNFRIHD